MRAVADVFDLTPRAIIEALDLRKPIYGETASYGHFGRTPKRVGSGRSGRTYFSWERTDRAAALKRAAQAEARSDASSPSGNGTRGSGARRSRYPVAALEDPADGTN
jgi:hypothetical protein